MQKTPSHRRRSGRKGGSPGLVANKSEQLARELRICTLNVRSIRTNSKFADFEQNVKDIGFDLFGVSETWRTGSECLKLGSGYVFYGSGHDGRKDAKTGVGFYVSQAMQSQVESVSCVSDRIIQIVVKLEGRNKVRVTQVYAPHTGYSDDEYDEFLEELSGSLTGKYRHDLIIGDFNAIVGQPKEPEVCCGNFCLGNRNGRGETLVDFCNLSNMTIMNSLFKKRAKRRWTWRSPNASTTNEIDYVLSANKLSVKDVSVLQRPNVGSDHRILRATLRVLRSHKTTKVKPIQLPPTYDRLKLQVNFQLQHISETAKYEEIIKAIKETMQTTAELPTKTPRISERTKNLMAKRQSMKFGLITGRTSQVEYSTVCKAIRWSLEDDLRNHYVVVMTKAIRKNRLKQGKRELAYKRKQMVHVRKDNGMPTRSTAETVKTVSEYYDKLYASSRGDFKHDLLINLDRPITADEIREACKRIKGNTAPGIDGIPSGVTKHCAPLAAEQLAKELHQMFSRNEFPESMMHANTILIHKKGDAMDIGNYRPISLMSTVFKVVTRVLTNRVYEKVCNQLSADQAGFRRGYSTVDHLLTINLLVEKCREWALPLCMVFIDFKKAFDTIEFNAIWQALEKYNIDPCTISMIKQLYAAGTTSVNVGGKRANFTTQRGVRQGDSLSPLLFVLTLQLALENVKWGERGYPINGKLLRLLAYADDIVLCAKSLQEMQTMLDDVEHECKKAGLEINVRKTKWMTNLESKDLLTLNGEAVEKVESFVYLGQVLTIPRDHNKEIGRRIGAAWATFGKARELLIKKRIPMYVKRRYFNQCILPSLLYGCETWALTKAMELRLARCQRAMERRMLGVRLIEKRSIAWIRKRTGLGDVVVKYRKRKWRHAAKILDQKRGFRWDKWLANWKPKTSRPLGRPRTRWEDAFIKTAGKHWQSCVPTPQWLSLLSTYTRQCL